VLRWLEALPGGAKRRRPRLFLEHALALALTGTPDDAELRPELNEGEVIAAFGDLVGLSRQEVAVGLTRRFGLENAARDRMVGFGVNTPSAEPPVDGLPSREVARQQPPRATALEDVEDGVQDLARAVSFRPSSP
jgi:hypothetical protein